jgi:hypothetical protein
LKLILKYSLVLFIATTILSCKEKYDPPVTKTDLNYLVVDGSLINGPDSTIIRLSRTKELDMNPESNGETGAQITVEDTQGNTLYNLTQEDNNGEYAVAGMNLNANNKYKLRINTSNGNQYVSDDLDLKQTPPIDSISWQLQPDGVTLYANTHDPQNDTKYYRWEYIETWDYSTPYVSLIKYQAIDSTLVLRGPDELIDHCWKTVHSDRILLGSSVKLSSDVISLSPLRFIPTNSIEISSLYSMLVKQYAVTKEAFEYFQNIKKISEQTGSLFDSQPSQLSSNIHCTNNPGQQVIGYVTASSLQQKRIFITKQQVDPWNFSFDCPQLRIITRAKDTVEFFFGGIPPFRVPIEEVPFGGVYASLPACGDCRIQGGITVKPDFWP